MIRYFKKQKTTKLYMNSIAKVYTHRHEYIYEYISRGYINQIFTNIEGWKDYRCVFKKLN